MLNPDFWLDEELASLSAYARLLYQGLWGICDDNYATLPNKPGWIKAQVFPYEDVDVKKLLVELSKSGRIILFQHENNEFWYIKNFFKHQRVDRPSKAKYPKYTGKSLTLDEHSTSTRPEDKISKDKIREDKLISGDKPPEVKKLVIDYSKIGTIKKGGGISNEWQEKAFRYADNLKINLSIKDDKGRDMKSRWLKMFKDAHLGIRRANLEQAASYLIDHPNKMGDLEKIKMFFFIYMNGLKKNT